MLAILFSALRALPIRVYVYGVGLLIILGLFIGLRVKVDRLKSENASLKVDIANLEVAVEKRDLAIAIQNQSIEAWKAAGEAKTRETAQAQAQASSLRTQHAQAIEQLKQAQAPSNADQALVWLAMNYNTWAAKVTR